MKKTTLLLALTTLVCNFNFARAQEPSRTNRVRLAIQPHGSNLEHARPNYVGEPVTEPGRSQRLDSPEAVPEGLSAPAWSSIRQQYEQHRHAAVPVESDPKTFQARNPGQQWQTRFDGRGFLTEPDAGGWQWGLELRSYGFAGHEHAVAGEPRVSTTGQRVAYDWDDMLQEWFVNDSRGLEHGFTLHQRPLEPSTLNSQPPTPLTFTLAVRGRLRPEVQADGRGVRFVGAEGAAALTYAGLAVLDADGRNLPAHFEPMKAERGVYAASTTESEGTVKRSEDRVSQTDTALLRLSIDERGARYPLTIDPIAQQAYLKASNTGGGNDDYPGDFFGCSVAVSGDTVVVGAQYEGSNATGVNGNQSDNSAPQSGAAYVFVRTGATWSQQAYLKASNTERIDQFGVSVAVSGDTVVVGAPEEASNATGMNGNQSNNSGGYSGAAYVFVRSGTNWSQQAYLKASNTGGYFGWSVSVSGDTVVVGAAHESSSATGVNGNQSNNSAGGSGAAYAFVRSGTNWRQQAYLKASNTGPGDRFGSSVAVSGDTVVVGASGEDSNATVVNGNQTDNSSADSGAAYVFARSGTSWSQQAYLKASNTGSDVHITDQFGSSVAVSGDTVVVGAPYEDSNATGVNGDQRNDLAPSSGAAHVFVRSGTTWSQQAYLKASNTEAYDVFGFSVAVSGDTVVVGAYLEDSNTTGVNGNQSDNSAFANGAAYLFARSGTNWSQQAYLKASNTDHENRFGYSVAVSGDTVVVGGPYEESSATGVNGDQSDTSAPQSGAAYIFTGLQSRLALVRNASGGYLIRFDGVPGFTYRLQRAPAVTGPWTTLATPTAPPGGLIEYVDTNPPMDTAFYRTSAP